MSSTTQGDSFDLQHPSNQTLCVFALDTP